MWLVALAIAFAASLASPLLARQGRPADAQQAVPAAGPLTLTLAPRRVPARGL